MNEEVMFEVAMINDCAYVGETLLKYFPSYVRGKHIKRTRGLWNKTFGLAYKIMNVRANIYHVHYLLQDCFLALKFKKRPLLGHTHGSDLREALKTKMWGWIVKYNLENCDKVLVAQPTILERAKEYNKTAEYFPIPYDPQLFYPKPLSKDRTKKHVLLASPHNFRVKGTDKLLHACAKIDYPIKIRTINYGEDAAKAMILARKLNLDVEFLPKMPHEKMNQLYWDADIVLGSFGIGQLDTVAIEAMASGRPVVHHIAKKFFPNLPLQEFYSIEEVSKLITELLIDTKKAEKVRESQLKYVNIEHRADVLVKRLLKIYQNMAVDV
jgi:glycosyltransferase involved in cell wall biosynthesis